MRPDITAHYMGLKLNSPIIVGSCPLTRSCESVRQYVIAGAGAIVLPSIFEEQIVHQRLARGSATSRDESVAELAYSECEDSFNGGTTEYLRNIEQLKRVTSVPIIASLDGFTGGSWLTFAKDIESSGADGIELNLHTDFADATLSADEVESLLLENVQEVCDSVATPVAIKLLPFFTSLPNLAWRLTEAGAAGLVVFGHEPNWIVMPDRLRATTQWSLTPAGSIAATVSGLIRVRCGGPNISIAANGGISAPAEVAQVVMAGADVAMVTSEVLREGSDAISHMVEGLISFLQRNEYQSFEAFVGARPNPDLAISQRLNYLQPLTDPAHYQDPTQSLPSQTGDRWGHPHDARRRHDAHSEEGA